MNRPLIKVYLVFICCLALIDVKAQDGYFKIDTVKLKRELRIDISFPILRLLKDTTTSRKINEYLQFNELHKTGYKGESNDLFSEVAPIADSNSADYMFINFSIISNTARVFSVPFGHTSCGATCYYWSAYYNFNPGNGDTILLSDLFTTEGYSLIKKAASEQRTSLLYKASNSIKYAELAIDTIELSYWDAVVAEYKRDDLIGDFLIKDTSIFVDGSGFIMKNERVLVGSISARIDISFFKNYLNDYGKAVFGVTDEPLGKYHSKGLSKLEHQNKVK